MCINCDSTSYTLGVDGTASVSDDFYLGADLFLDAETLASTSNDHALSTGVFSDTRKITYTPTTPYYKEFNLDITVDPDSSGASYYYLGDFQIKSDATNNQDIAGHHDMRMETYGKSKFSMEKKS